MATRRAVKTTIVPKGNKIMTEDMYSVAEIPTQEREKQPNPHAKIVRDIKGVETARAITVVESEAEKHIRWLRSAGVDENVTVRVSLKRNDEEIKPTDLNKDDDKTHVKITFWTRPKITRTRKDDSSGSGEQSDEQNDEQNDETPDDSKAPTKATSAKK
jgi:hypothetical protein